MSQFHNSASSSFIVLMIVMSATMNVCLESNATSTRDRAQKLDANFNHSHSGMTNNMSQRGIMSAMELQPTSEEEIAQKMINLGYDFWREPPQELDWSNDSRRVGPVRNQGVCNSSVAFAIVGLLESEQRLYQDVVLLSEQHIIDCFMNETFCSIEGDPIKVLQAIKRNHGISIEEDYPQDSGIYGQIDECKADKPTFPTTRNIGAIHLLPHGDEQLMKRMVANYGPILLTISVDNEFTNHTAGQIYAHNGEYAMKRSVLLVGYGKRAATPYWKIKNSLGTSWGDRGYGLIIRNSSKIWNDRTKAMIILPSEQTNLSN